MEGKNKKIDKMAENVIRNHVIWSMGAGLIPILVADIFAVSALQVDMIKQLCDTYDKDYEVTKGKAYVTSLTSSTLARLGARSLVKLIPGVGSYIGGVAVSVFAGASTYALGQVFKAHFASGGTILDFDPDRVRKYYQEMFEKGKAKAKQWQGTKPENVDVSTPPDVEAEPAASESPVFSTPPVIVEDPEPPTIEDVPEKPTLQEVKEVVKEEPDLLTQLQKLAALKESGAITEAEFMKLKNKIIESF